MQRHDQISEPGYLVGVHLKSDPEAWSLESSMEELAALAESAGVQVQGASYQRLDQPHPSTLIGSGKVEELKLAIADAGASVVLFDHELSPRQQRNLENALEMMVIDRTALILDVFARHARTREGMLQVELAQYEYRLPRLTRLWTHLARQSGGRAGGASGGVGVRGPGETQLEIDRREIRRRIAFLAKSLEELRAQRRRSREARLQSGQPVVSLVGYTNAGKSTLLNALTDADVYTADQLFATLDPTTRRVRLPSGRQALVSDTVGFIQKLPTQLIAAFRATLEEVTEADLLVHVVDVTHPDAVRQAETVEAILTELGALSTVPMVVAANKVDALVPDFQRGATKGAVTKGAVTKGAVTKGAAPSVEACLAGDTAGIFRAISDAYPDLVPVSAAQRWGLDALLAAIDAELQSHLVEVRALIPYGSGDLLHQIHEYGVVLDESSDEHGTLVRARVPRGLAASIPGMAPGQVGGT